jgi:hypothetical protein
MKRVSYYLAILIIMLSITGCGHIVPTGGIYTHITTPLDIDLSQTPRAETVKTGDIKHIQYYGDISWDSNAIGEIAKQSGLETVYFADLETFSILGIWNQYKVHVYGK